MSDRVTTFYLSSDLFEVLAESALKREMTVSQLIRELLFIHYQELSEVSPFLLGGERKGDLIKVSVRLDHFLLEQLNQVSTHRYFPRNSLVHALLHSLITEI
ncbi:MAG: ribbon-helix-helix protein, CopG family [Cyanobacteria bacterium]|jgi:predicted DNA-binding ribbon-helix-helix protein|nr:ribbon-helix-helix protein, CopG family [Cyanobacteria bacterium GSL.Bin21]